MTTIIFASNRVGSNAIFAPNNGVTVADTTAPVFTGTLVQTAVSSSTCTIDWSGTTHTDNVGITGYEYSINGGIYYAIGNVLSYLFTGFAASTTYTIAIRAFDAAGNRSAALSITTTTTSAATSTVTMVTVTPGTATGSQQFTATVIGTNSPSQAVTWAASAGSITSGGLFTAPAATSVIQTITVTATSTQDGTKSRTATVTIAAVVVGTAYVISVPQINGAASPGDHADYLLLAANDQRKLIGVVPGSGQMRGVAIYSDIVYAFRDNAAGTAGAMYKATAGGWVLVPFGTEIQFTAGASPISVGDTIGNAASAPTATATVVAVLLRTGTFGTAGAGTLIIAPVTGTFTTGSIYKGATLCATASTGATAITRAPGGRVETFNYNFTGSTNTTKMYGADGVNLAFEFDGTTYIPIRTGMATDTPNHVIAHRGYLFLSFLASVQYSSLGAPYSWTVVTGSGEIDVSKVVTGFLPQGGNIAGSSLGIFTAERTFVLYGSSNADFKLVSSIFDVGYLPYTLQQVSNNAYGMTSRGIQALLTTLNYGDFDYASVSHMIQPLITKKRGLECASTALRNKNQYRVYFTDGTAITVGLTGDKESGIMPLNYGRPVRCIVSAPLSTGAEVTFFGSDDGYIYQDNIGTSQDGAAIEAWCRLPFNNDKSPRIRKRFRRAIFELTVDGFSKVNISYDLGYANPLVQPSASQPDQVLAGGGGYWDQFTWDSFTWDTQFVANPVLTIDGTEKNIGLLFYSNRAQDQSHTLQGVTLVSTQRILERS